jgi:RNA polymerase sigma-70 factor (ECF subfamily)
VPDGSRSFASNSPDLDRVAALFRAHFGFVRRVLRRCGVAEADLDDAVQEVFIVVHRRIDDFEGRASETTWLYAVAVRVASTLRRSASRERARREKAGEQMHGAGEADPERELSRQEAGALLDRLLDELDGTKRTVFVLAELEGVPVPEIAQIMDANLRTTHSRLRLARKRFNAALERHHAQESGRMRRASLRTLAKRAEPQRPEPKHARAAWAALAVRISDGATPMAISWTGAAAAATSKGFWLPFAITVGLGAGGLGVAVAVTQPDAPPAVESSPPASVATAEPAPNAPPAVASGPILEPAPEPPVIPEPEPPVEPEIAPTPKPRPKPKTKPPAAAPTVVDASTLEAETALLERARAKLRASDPEAALRLLGQHERQYANGLLAAERKTTQVKALCKAGRADEARRRAGTNARLKAVVEAACE